MDTDAALREQLQKLLQWGHAHVDFEAAVANFPIQHINSLAPGVPYSPWQLLEHLRLAQWDILEFCINPEYAEREFPKDYWPDPQQMAGELDWNRSVVGFRKDLRAMIDLVTDTSIDLFAAIPHGDGQTLLREALLLADHNAYHIGQLVTLRRALGAWPPPQDRDAEE